MPFSALTSLGSAMESMNVAFRVTSGSASREDSNTLMTTVPMSPLLLAWWTWDRLTEQGSNWWKMELNPRISLTSLHVKCGLQSSHVDRKHTLDVHPPENVSTWHQIELISCVIAEHNHPVHFPCFLKCCYIGDTLRSRREVWFSSQHQPLKLDTLVTIWRVVTGDTWSFCSVYFLTIY